MNLSVKMKSGREHYFRDVQCTSKEVEGAFSVSDARFVVLPGILISREDVECARCIEEKARPAELSRGNCTKCGRAVTDPDNAAVVDGDGPGDTASVEHRKCPEQAP